jgi:hypothetical protein
MFIRSLDEWAAWSAAAILLWPALRSYTTNFRRRMAPLDRLPNFIQTTFSPPATAS